jgi:predicted dinucleotide-binding enzyme
MKKIGIIGSGVVGQTLGSGFIKHGFEVMLGTRTPSKLESWLREAGKAGKVGSVSEAAAFGEMLVLAVKGDAAAEALESAGHANLKGKVIIDTCNPISDEAPEKGVLKFFTTLDNSLMEQLQKSFPEAYLVKAFSNIGSSLMVNPDFDGEKPTMFICGNNENAKRKVSGILVRFGFDVSDMGTVEAARAIEPLCILWCIPGLLRNEWSHAFRLLKS